VLDNTDTVLTLGDRRLVFDTASLRELVQKGTEALTKLGADPTP
jgi:hypothetical protein